ncbi:phospholipid/cholesterol/gamma-HCH transport system substrate-binding protein [Nocardioides sp. BE266]|uniref:MCE family protein n=1 Tax=Nocardioides sp. BE266 TaxID=2817725 RepID=UPI00285A0411|nr:MCE family protein [Nocardioides sp. BE266]MDR7255577.1 phospholipid/cholesterol/gamma-HCH transport system substrate-binding protein [Nocardioides sp. BE266]
MKRVKVLVLGVLVAMFLSACDFSVYGLPLPGGPDVGDNPMTIKVEFADVLDLVPQSTVKVNDVSVGKVTAIDLEGYQALVTLQVRRDVKLPDNAVAELRQTSLLGEKFVELSAPDTGASANALSNGDTIPIERAGRNPEVEEVLGALSLLLNGGGVAQLKTITQELNSALDGREDSARSVLDNLRTFMGQVDDNKADIVHAIEQLNRLSIAAEKQLPTIDKALDELPSALESIDRQRDDLVQMLEALDNLSAVAVDVIAKSKDSTITSLQRLNPVLTQLAASGDDFTNAFHVFLTYPFVDEVVGRDPQVARNLHMGDYTNLSITLDVDVAGGASASPSLPTNLPTVIDPTVIVNDVLACLQSGSLTSDACKKVLANAQKLLQLREECAKAENKDKDVCRELNAIPGLPSPPVPVPTTLPPTLLPTTLLPTGLPRAGTDEREPRGGYTVRDLMDLYDPALVSLLVPGMVER